MSAGRDDEPTAAIEYTTFEYKAKTVWSPGTPSDCIPQARARVRIVDIAQVESGWLAYGAFPTVKGDACGTVFQMLAHYIPIECAAFPCPGCGPGSELTTEILSITETEPGYNFVARLKCDKCSKPHLLSRVLGGLAKITKVKVGPTGVEVEVTP
jgi:hypothetical protein